MDMCLMVTTRNRRTYIARLLDSLRAQRLRTFIVLLGVQDPDIETIQLVESYRNTMSIVLVELPACSLSAARNALLPFVRGDVVALTDDDCFYAPDTLYRVAEAFRDYPNMGVCVGQDADNIVCGKFLARVNRYTVFYKVPSWVLFFRRSVFGLAGAFDETLGVGADSPWQSGEETDFLLRLLAQGQQILRVPSIRVYHPKPEYHRSDMACKWRSYGMGRMRVLAKHRLPFWFVLLNILYPVWGLLRHPSRAAYQLSMLHGRLAGLLQGVAQKERLQ